MKGGDDGEGVSSLPAQQRDCQVTAQDLSVDGQVQLTLHSLQVGFSSLISMPRFRPLHVGIQGSEYPLQTLETQSTQSRDPGEPFR